MIRSVLVLVGAIATAFPAVGTAQSARQLYATRDALEARAADAERLVSAPSTSSATREQKRIEALELRTRLDKGDFHAGDQIVVSTTIERVRIDTLTVDADQSIDLGQFPKVSLRGVLRSELEDRLRSHLATYVREPRVSAQPLVRLSVTGQVGRPGFYNVPANALVTDVIMLAGGPTSAADISKSVVRRDNEKLWDRDEVRTAISDGYSIDTFDLRAGDELVVGEKKRTNWEAVLRNAGVVVGLVSLFYTVR
jgi:protein involved in polysaccharide export with SLBB domain